MKQLITIIFLYFGLNSFGQLNATITASDYEVCVGDTVLITMICGGGTNPYTLVHSVNGGAPLTVLALGDTAYITVIYTSAGTYVYSLNEIQDSQGNVAQLNSSISVVVNPLPTATIVSDITVCVGDPSPIVTFTGANATAPYTFVYNINSSSDQTLTSMGNSESILVPTSNADTLVYYLTGVYDNSSTACYQDQIGQATVIIENCAGLNDVGNEQIDVYPNPANNILMIEGTYQLGTEYFRVLDTKGKVIMEGELLNSSIDISSIQSGFYFLEIIGDLKMSVRFIKE